jgi:UDP-N-acetylglucosamine--N-acetylmuramyl-(pentapeptide) pyrophosphoryl-undecaprenol N-acetylglucosamine transferase
VNDAVAGWVQRGLPEGWNLIWATGRAGYEQHAGLEQPRVRVRPYLSPIAEAYAACDLALARAGAMTTAELCAWGIPMVLVPLPTAAADHQTANARALERAGAAVRLDQHTLTVERLDAAISQLAGDAGRLQAVAHKAAERGRPDAAEAIARRILRLLDVKQIRS